MTIGKPTHNSKMIVKFLLKKNEEESKNPYFIGFNAFLFLC